MNGSNVKKIDYAAGISAILLALIYVGAFIYFGAFWAYPSSAEISEQLGYLSDNHLTISVVYFSMYILFGVILSVLVWGYMKNTPQASHFICVNSLLYLA